MLEKKMPVFEMQLPAYVVALLYLTLPNLPPLLAAGTLGALPHGYINIECLLIGAAALWMPRSAIFALLIFEALVDFAYSICFVYKFSPGELLSSLSYLTVMPAHRVLAGFAVLTLSILLCAFLALVRSRAGKRHRTAIVLLACVVIFTAIDMFDGQNLLWRKDATLTSYRLVRSPLFVMGLWEASSIRRGGQTRNGSYAPMSSASAHALSYLDNRAGSPQSPNVVLVVVESWGLLLDARLANALAAPYDDPRIARKYTVSYGAAPFTGLTVPGEARELCHSMAGFAIIHDAAEMAAQCLPAYFHSRGYQAFAIHGFVGQMFYRSTWYPALGFDRTWFEPELKTEGLPSCRGAFPGICDASIANWISSSLLSAGSPQPRFIYWVTLNSHIPVPAHPDLPGDGVCSAQPALQSSVALCSWYRLVHAVHESVQQVALKATARPTVFILVGDHAPPFSDPRLRSAFSSTQVPYVMLTPVETPQR